MSVAISNDDGDYGAVIVSGGNQRSYETLLALESAWPGVGAVALQNEVLEALNLAAARQARFRGVPACFNAAPAHPLSSDLLACVDILIAVSR